MTTMTATKRARQLTGHDRCDKCRSRAYFLALNETSELTFCAHHGMEFKARLESQGFIVFDETSALTEEMERD